jgi:hypothetical protein
MAVKLQASSVDKLRHNHYHWSGASWLAAHAQALLVLAGAPSPAWPTTVVVGQDLTTAANPPAMLRRRGWTTI